MDPALPPEPGGEVLVDFDHGGWIEEGGLEGQRCDKDFLRGEV